MTVRPEVHTIGIESICRYSIIRLGLTAVGRKIAIFQKFIRKQCTDPGSTGVADRKISGAQRVLGIIQESEQGVDPSIIRQLTGFKEQKTARILYKLFKYGLIKIGSGGLYLAVARR